MRSMASNIKVFVLAWCSHRKRIMDCMESARVKDISLFHTARIRNTSEHDTYFEVSTLVYDLDMLMLPILLHQWVC